MKRPVRIALVLVAVVALLVAGLLAWMARKKPAMRPAPDLVVDASPARVAHGKYLVTHVAACLQCHSTPRLDLYSMPATLGSEGGGGLTFDESMGMPGRIIPSNITPDHGAGIGAWTDGEIARAIREGVSRDGRALFPMMPYPHYRHMSDDDLNDVIAYLRTLRPLPRKVETSRIAFPASFFIKGVPQPIEGPVAGPAPDADPVERGSYLVTIAGCRDCHTPMGPRGPDTSRELSGGWEMKGPWGRVVSANLTPHPSTFVGRSSSDEFVARFKRLRLSGGRGVEPPPAGQSNTIMPWWYLAGMSVEDLRAIHAYLKSLPPVENDVVTFPDAVSQPAGAAGPAEGS